jgi:hypothetical protein
MMRFMKVSQYVEDDSRSRNYADIKKYMVSFGSEAAPHRVDIFYGVECGFTKEFLQQDFEQLLVDFVLTGKAYVCLYPAALDKLTLAFCNKVYALPPAEKRRLFMHLCHPIDYRMLMSKLTTAVNERVFFDVAKILERNQEISETLMVRVNQEVLEDIPSIYALQKKIA